MEAGGKDERRWKERKKERKKEGKKETKERTNQGVMKEGRNIRQRKKNRKSKVKNLYFMSTSSIYFLLFTHSFSDDSSSVTILFHK